MTWQKRLLDVTFLLTIVGPIMLPVLGGLVLYIWVREGRPIFYGSERMRSPRQSFTLWKLRTMTVAHADSGVSGGDKDTRITRIGRVLRRTRMDELPQMLNILRGDISFVGPRPPLREYVDRFPDIYEQVLRSRPGATGLASLVYARHETWILGRCRSAEETDAVYARACVPRKARLDLLYQRHAGIGFDCWLICVTSARVLRLQRGRRFPRAPRVLRGGW